MVALAAMFAAEAQAQTRESSSNPEARVEPLRPGVTESQLLAELAAKTASFRDIITKDKQSSLHLISSGQVPTDRGAILVAPSMTTNFDALARGYDRVVIAAGATVGPELEEISAIAPHAILVAGTLTEAGTAAARERLLGAGFADVTLLGTAAHDAGETAAAA